MKHNYKFRFSQNSENVLSTVSENLQLIGQEAIKITLIDFGYPTNGGHRFAEQQFELWIAGKSKCDGYNIISKHQTRKALDFFAYVDGKASYQKEHLAIVAAAHLQAATKLGIPLNWGGLWGWDFSHIEEAD